MVLFSDRENYHKLTPLFYVTLLFLNVNFCKNNLFSMILEKFPKKGEKVSQVYIPKFGAAEFATDRKKKCRNFARVNDRVSAFCDTFRPFFRNYFEILKFNYYTNSVITGKVPEISCRSVAKTLFAWNRR